MSHRFEGRNLEEALQQAAQTLGVERWQLTHHILLQKRGFLGGTKRVVIDVDVNQEAAPPPGAQPAAAAAPAVAATPAPQTAAPAPARAPMPEAPRMPPRERKPAGGGGGGRGRGGRNDRGGGGGRNDRGGRSGGNFGGGDRGPARGPRGGGGESGRGGGGRGRGSRGNTDFRTGDFETFIGDLPAQGPESDQAKLVREWCEDVIALSRLDLVIRTEENETQIHVKLYGADARRLTDEDGELLDAIQVLANKALVRRKVEKEIELDCESFKDRRMEDLGQRAREAADRVRQEGREELLPAMTPIERRIVHLALQEDADVTTESRGEGFYKRVAIVRRTEPLAQPAPETPEPAPEG